MNRKLDSYDSERARLRVLDFARAYAAVQCRVHRLPSDAPPTLHVSRWYLCICIYIYFHEYMLYMYIHVRVHRLSSAAPPALYDASWRVYLYMYVYVYICMYTYLYTDYRPTPLQHYMFPAGAYIYIPICIYLYVYAYIYMPICIYVHVYAYIYIPICVCLYLYAYIYMSCTLTTVRRPSNTTCFPLVHMYMYIYILS